MTSTIEWDRKLTDHEQRIIYLETCAANLLKGQEQQNGTVARIEGKIDRLFYWVVGSLVSAVAALLAVIVKIVLLGV